MKYTKDKILYKTSSNIIYSGIMISDKQEIIIKEYLNMKTEINNNEINIPIPEYDKELIALQKIHHDSIIKFYGYKFLKNGSFELIIEKGQMDLLEYISIKDYNQKTIEIIIKTIIMGIHNIHKCKFIHADIKPKNIVWIKNEKFKIIDFDSCINTRNYFKENYNIQTLNYKAPEILLKNDIISKFIDIWGVGLILYELINKKPLFNHYNDEDNISQINTMFLENGEIKEIYYEKMNNTLLKIFINSMKFKPFERSSASNLLKLF